MSHRPPKNDKERLENLIEALSMPEDEDDALDEQNNAELARRGLTLESWAAQIRAQAQAVLDRNRRARRMRTLGIVNDRQFGIAVAGYPETHQEAVSPQADLENLRRKVEAGGDIVITQLFYVNDDFFRFRERCQQLGIRAPIVPGILPVTNLAQIQRITSMCGAHLPVQLSEALAAAEDDADRQFEAGIAFAIRQVQELVDAG